MGIAVALDFEGFGYSLVEGPISATVVNLFIEEYLEAVEESVGVIAGKAERREQTYGIGAGTAGKDVMAEKEIAAFGGSVGQIYADHQSAATHIGQPVHLPESRQQILTCPCSIGH